MFKNLLFITIGLSLVAATSHGQGSVNEGQTSGTATSTRTSVPASGTDKYNSASTGEGAASGGSGVNAMVGGGLMAAGGVCMAATCGKPACSPGCFILLAMGGTALLQSAMTGGDANKSGAIADMAYSCPNCDPNIEIPDYYKTAVGDGSIFDMDPKQKVPYGPFGTIGEIQQSLIKHGKILDEHGIVVNDDDSATLKDGTVISAAQMQAAANGEGLRSEDASAVKDLMDKAKKYGEDAEAYSVAAMDIGGEGGGGGSGFKPYESSFDMSKYLNGLYKKRKPASVIGKTKRVNGEPIGVAGDDIFKMIQRRYQAKTRTKTFIESMSAGSPRAPAVRSR